MEGSEPLKNMQHESFSRSVANGATLFDSAVCAEFKVSRASQTAARLMNRPEIKARIAFFKKEAVNVCNLSETAVRVTQERLVQEMSCAAFLNPQDLYHEDGTMKTILELPEHVARAIGAIDITQMIKQDGTVVSNTKIKFVSKEKSQEMLARTLAMFKDKQPEPEDEKDDTGLSPEMREKLDEIYGQKAIEHDGGE